MVNKALCDDVEQQIQEKLKRAAEFDENQKLRKGRLKFLSLIKDQPRRNSPLHDYEKGLTISYHLVPKLLQNGKTIYETAICDRQYAKFDPQYTDSCPYCKLRVQNRNNNPIDARFLVMFCHDLAEADGSAATFKPEGSDTTYEVNPVRVCPIRAGKGAANLTEMITAAQKGHFMRSDHVWILAKTGEGKLTNYLAPVHKLKDLLADEGDFEVPKAISEEFSKKTDDDIAQLILGAFDHNVRWEIWDVPKPTVDDAPASTSTKEEAKEEVAKGSSKNKLK